MTPASVTVKQDIHEVGIGSLEAEEVWASDPTQMGELAHLSKSADGRYWLSITDLEEFHGSSMSVEVTASDLMELFGALVALKLPT